MVYKLLAVNIDGTLLQSNGRLSKETKEAIEYVYRKGIAIALVTSRNCQSARKFIRSLKIKPMIVAAQGAYVGTTFDKPLFIKKINDETTLNTVKLLEGVHCQFTLNLEDSQVCNRINLPENIISRAVLYVSEQSAFSTHYLDSVSEYMKKHQIEPVSIEALFDNQEERNDAAASIRAMHKDISVVPKGNTRLLIVPEGVSKWNGVSYLADHAGIAARQIVAIGDSEDDLDLIKYAGIGVAMGNSPAMLRKEADWVARTNDDDGVAYTVKELFRKQYKLQFIEEMKVQKK